MSFFSDFVEESQEKFKVIPRDITFNTVDQLQKIKNWNYLALPKKHFEILFPVVLLSTLTQTVFAKAPDHIF